MVKIPLEKDFFSLERVVYVKGKVISPCQTELFPSYILVPHYRGAVYNIIYKATLDRITRVTADSYIIPLPENLAEAIPYFVKSELYAQENESEAVRSRQIFDQLVGEYELTKLPCDECLEMIYSMNGDKLW